MTIRVEGGRVVDQTTLLRVKARGDFDENDLLLLWKSMRSPEWLLNATYSQINPINATDPFWQVFITMFKSNEHESVRHTVALWFDLMDCKLSMGDFSDEEIERARQRRIEFHTENDNQKDLG